MTTLQDALAERDAILTAMDIEAAKGFINRHDGFVPKGNIDWERVLHLARFEVTTLPDELLWESRIWLARHGAQSLMMLPPTSPYLRAALDLVFPKDLTDTYLKAMS